jgi:hypothetical protein
MNARIQQLADQAKKAVPQGLGVDKWIETYNELFAELIIKECMDHNRKQSYELLGVIADAEEGDGFDAISLGTVKRVSEYLSTGLKDKVLNG